MRDNVNRRKFLGGAAAAVTGATALTGEAAGHYVGQAIFANHDLWARTGPGTSYDVISTVNEDTGMYITGGPWDRDGYRWWQVRVNEDEDSGRIWEAYIAEKKSWGAYFAIPSGGNITSEWYSSRSYGYHKALDIANDYYTNVYSGRRGYHTQHYASGCGNYSVIDHDGGYETYYCHLDSWVAGHGVNVGTYHHIGEMGSTGNSSGPHVHYQIRRYGDPVYMPGHVDEYQYKYTGVGKKYDGISDI